MKEICQSHLPDDPASSQRLPGLQLVAEGDWLRRDDAYDAQLAYRKWLLETRREDVLRLDEEAEDAAAELLEVVVAEERLEQIEPDNPLVSLSKIVQEDFVIMQKIGDEHVLTGGVLCFPASWTLAEKFMKPLIRIHNPVEEYDANVAKRVQRIFDGVQVGRPMWRANYLAYSDPDLYQPRTENDPRGLTPDGAKYIRSERQCLVRLPKTKAVVFSIHTTVVPIERVTDQQKQAIQALS